MKIEMQHAAGANLALVANPVRLSQTPTTYRHAPPTLGADTNTILTELGLTADDIEALKAKKLV